MRGPWDAHGKQQLALGWGWGKASWGAQGSRTSIFTERAVLMVARRQTHMPARAGEGCIQHPLGKRGSEPPRTVGCTVRMSTPQPQDRVHMQLLLPTDPAPPRCHPPSAAGCPHTHPAAHTPVCPSQHPAKEAGPVSLPTSHPRTPWVLSLGCRRRYASSNSFPIVWPET